MIWSGTYLINEISGESTVRMGQKEKHSEKTVSTEVVTITVLSDYLKWKNV